MSAFFGWPAFVHPDYPAGFTLDVHAPSFICVDGDGHRFADETGWEVHDRVRAFTAYLPRHRNRPRMPGWIKRGADSAELAAATGLDSAVLRSTLAGYAAAVSRRADHEFGLPEHGGGLTDAIVFGRIAGAHAAADAAPAKPAATR